MSRTPPAPAARVTITVRDAEEYKALICACERARRDGDGAQFLYLIARLREVSDRFVVDPPPKRRSRFDRFRAWLRR